MATVYSGGINGKSVERLLACAVLYEVARGLFPYTETYEVDLEEDLDDKEEEKEALGEADEEENKEETKIDIDGSQDLISSLEQLRRDTEDDTKVETHITDEINKLSAHKTNSIDEKEDELIQKLIETKLSDITDEDLDERIKSCKTQARDIIDSFKLGDKAPEPRVTDEEISSMIKDALSTPEEEDEPSIAFPELPSTLPGNNIDKGGSGQDIDPKEDTSEEDEEEQQQEPVRQTESTHMQKQDVETYLSHDQSLEAAQRCAKFAISAINYEDVDTALKELKKAVKLLETVKGE